MSDQKPSDFTNYPIASVLQKNESETVARNIMMILRRTGNTWRNLSWDEYVKHRTNDGNFTMNEKPHFDAVIGYCQSPETAKLFSPTAWTGKVE